VRVFLLSISRFEAIILFVYEYLFKLKRQEIPQLTTDGFPVFFRTAAILPCCIKEDRGCRLVNLEVLDASRPEVGEFCRSRTPRTSYLLVLDSSHTRICTESIPRHHRR